MVDKAFHAAYFTLRTMANAYKKRWQSLRGDLEHLRIAPFTRDERNYGRIFVRTTVEAALGQLAVQNGDDPISSPAG